ncbi:hypothetical protein [Burkholderia vietnamiensis]|jgi:hypothetical protein|uniref:hypothetical protein n=1 Tax=Burkholderia vietnamiensis TaxID=60552 RepID=UPI001041AF17|nr:hypothetical protein [Burkholderia vietnamiensis]
MKPISDITDPPLRPARAGVHRITDRQVEIMTSTLCDAVAGTKLPPEDARQAVGELIGAMVKQVTRLNQAVAVANDPSDLGVKVTINNIGRPVVEHDEDQIAAIGRLAR